MAYDPTDGGGGSPSPWPTQKTSVQAGEICTVDAGDELLVGDGFEILGDLVVMGDVITPYKDTPRANLIQRIRLSGVSVNSANSDVGLFRFLPAKWRLRKLSVLNPSASLATSLATLGLYTASGGGGHALVALATVTALTAKRKILDMTLASVASTDVQTGGTVYLRNGVANGASVTVDAILEIEDLTGAI